MNRSPTLCATMSYDSSSFSSPSSSYSGGYSSGADSGRQLQAARCVGSCVLCIHVDVAVGWASVVTCVLLCLVQPTSRYGPGHAGKVHTCRSFCVISALRVCVSGSPPRHCPQPRIQSQGVILQSAVACFNICAKSSSGSLSRREKSCVENCVDRTFDAKFVLVFPCVAYCLLTRCLGGVLQAVVCRTVALAS